MSTDSLEQEMRRALFGGSADQVTQTKLVESKSHPTKQKKALGYASKLRVELQVTNVFEGDCEVVYYESAVLSTLVAEMEARKKYTKKYRYVTIVGTTRI